MKCKCLGFMELDFETAKGDRIVGTNFYYSWRNGITVRSFIFISAIILGIAALVIFVFKLNGERPVANPPSEHSYSIFLDIVFDTVSKISSLGLVPPAHSNDLVPAGEKYYLQGITAVYVYTCLKSKAEVNIEKIYRVFGDYLLRNQAIERMGFLGGMRNYKGILLGPITLIDIKQTEDYIRIELAMTDENAVRIKRLRSAARNKKQLKTVSVNDDEY